MITPDYITVAPIVVVVLTAFDAPIAPIVVVIASLDAPRTTIVVVIAVAALSRELGWYRKGNGGQQEPTQRPH